MSAQHSVFCSSPGKRLAALLALVALAVLTGCATASPSGHRGALLPGLSHRSLAPVPCSRSRVEPSPAGALQAAVRDVSSSADGDDDEDD